jgi:hypothetical protein
VPHTPSLYDLLLVFFVCQTLRETMVLALLTHALYWGWVVFGSANTFDAYALGLGQVAVWVVYLPALLMVLRRPNEAPAVDISAWRGWRDLLPATHVDVTLLGVLALAGAMLVWLPLVTYR